MNYLVEIDESNSISETTRGNRYRGWAE